MSAAFDELTKTVNSLLAVDLLANAAIQPKNGSSIPASRFHLFIHYFRPKLSSCVGVLDFQQTKAFRFNAPICLRCLALKH